MKSKLYTDPIIVIIATSFGRTNLLFERSLRSVYEQTKINPHQIYIVDDNPIKKNERFSDEYFQIKSVVKQLRNKVLKPKFEKYKTEYDAYDLKFDNFFHTTIIRNKRTIGFSGTGAWNTAAFKSLQYSGRTYFFAFLDDDDSWEKRYLRTIYEKVKRPIERKIKGRIKTIKTIAAFAGILRIEEEKEIEIQPTDEHFTKENFFIKNVGLQGSNLFIEQKTFWTIGGFDESLKSATDRDLAIRLIEYENIRPSKEIGFVDEILVKHYAISGNRVTSKKCSKKQGLDTFYRKYLHQFPIDIQEKSLARAKKLFSYRITNDNNKYESNIPSNISTVKFSDKLNLIIGAISDNTNNLTELFKTFENLIRFQSYYIESYVFYILENTDNEFKIRPIIDYFVSQKGLNIELLENPITKGSIAENRTFLQNSIYEKGKEVYNNNFVTWIVDDDHLFNDFNYFYYILKNKNSNYDALLGQISDAPPLPFLSTLRSQLVDFYYNLTHFENCDPEAKFELNDLQKQNIDFKEFYYDLSNKNFQHLEYPYFFASSETTNLKAFEQFLTKTSLLSKGVNVFRKLEYTPESIGKITGTSIYRGGNTIIYNPELLKTPNYTPEDEYNRRSDFNWSLINKHIFGRQLNEIILPLKHDRHFQETSLITNEKKLGADIKGLIFYRLLDYLLSKEDWETKTEFDNEILYFKQIKDDTFNKVKINNYRILSLLHLILYKLQNAKLWWWKNKYRKEINYIVQQNIFLIEVLRVELGKRKFQIFIESLEQDIKINTDFIKKIQVDMNEIKKATKSNKKT